MLSVISYLDYQILSVNNGQSNDNVVGTCVLV